MDYTKLYEILDDNNIGYERDENNRDVAIKIILELKKRKAKKYKGILVENEDVITTYLVNGMDGIKTMFKRNLCYLYSTDFIFNVLFNHYKREWVKLETLIIKEIKNGANPN